MITKNEKETINMAMKKRAREPFAGSANQTINFISTVEELLLINDGEASLSFTAGYFTFTLKPGEVFDEEIDPFKTLKITATGAYRGYVRDVY